MGLKNRGTDVRQTAVKPIPMQRGPVSADEGCNLCESAAIHGQASADEGMLYITPRCSTSRKELEGGRVSRNEKKEPSTSRRQL